MDHGVMSSHPCMYKLASLIHYIMIHEHGLEIRRLGEPTCESNFTVYMFDKTCMASKYHIWVAFFYL